MTEELCVCSTFEIIRKQSLWPVCYLILSEENCRIQLLTSRSLSRKKEKTIYSTNW